MKDAFTKLQEAYDNTFLPEDEEVCEDCDQVEEECDCLLGNWDMNELRRVICSTKE